MFLRRLGYRRRSPTRLMSTSTNPYQSPIGSPARNVELLSAPMTHRVRLAWLCAYLYPILVLCAFYGTWLLACSALGRAPRPMLDDPKSIDGLMQIVHFIPAILIMAMPVLAPMGLVASFVLPRNRRDGWIIARRCILASLYVAACFTVLRILWADPGQVVEWYFD
jgi:hypothetical protein